MSFDDIKYIIGERIKRLEQWKEEFHGMKTITLDNKKELIEAVDERIDELETLVERFEQEFAAQAEWFGDVGFDDGFEINVVFEPDLDFEVESEEDENDDFQNSYWKSMKGGKKK